METARPTTPILELAWRRVAQLDLVSTRRASANMRVQRWLLVLAVLTTLFAIMTQQFDRTELGSLPLLSYIVRAIFVAMPFLAAGLVAFSSRFFGNGDWLITRAAAEEITKEIYLYRTILQSNRDRRRFLEKRLAEIQRQLYRALSGVYSFEEYSGRVPHRYWPDDPASDPGFSDLTGDDYFTYRLDDQLRWHNRKVNQSKTERDLATANIVGVGLIGGGLALWGGNIGIWAALTASITSTLLCWQSLRNLESKIRNYSKVVLELSVLRDRWLNLEPEERTAAEFYGMVRSCEQILWAQNTEYIRSMQEALQESSLEREASLVNSVIRQSVESAERTKELMRESVITFTERTMENAERRVEETFQEAIGNLAEEASSDLVQQELASMDQARSRMEVVPSTTQMEIGPDTTKEEINQTLARHSKTAELKG